MYLDIELVKKKLIEVVHLLSRCEAYISDINSGALQPKSEVGRMLNNCLSQLSQIDTKSIEAMVQDNFQDLLMVGSLSKLTQTHVKLAERINNLLSSVLI